MSWISAKQPGYIRHCYSSGTSTQSPTIVLLYYYVSPRGDLLEQLQRREGCWGNRQTIMIPLICLHYVDILSIISIFHLWFSPSFGCSSWTIFSPLKTNWSYSVSVNKFFLLQLFVAFAGKKKRHALSPRNFFFFFFFLPFLENCQISSKLGLWAFIQQKEKLSFNIDLRATENLPHSTPNTEKLTEKKPLLI